MNPFNMDSDPAFASAVDAVKDKGVEFTKAIGALPFTGPHLLCLLMSAVSGQIAAITLMSTQAAEGRPIKDDDVLFAALMIASILHPVNDGFQMEFHPGSYLDAMEKFEKLTGRKAEEVAYEPIAKAARYVAKAADENVIDFLTKLAEAHRNRGSDTKH